MQQFISGHNDYLFSNKITANNLSPALMINSSDLFEEDQIWVNDLEELLNSNISNNTYKIFQLAYDLSISERQLRRKCKELLGCTPNQLFRRVRIQRASIYLSRRRFKTISQVAYAVGYRDVPSFKNHYFNLLGRSVNDDIGK
ncbi:MAG: helix-turn-helix domain-containing protein [Bacteroidota bacterium]